MKVKTAELDGLALDWAVAVARNMPDIKIFGPVRHNDRGWIEVRFNPDHRALGSRYDPSINPEFSWPIIDANGISLIKQTETRWVSEYSLGCSRPDHARAWGPSSLVAALRCFCLEKHGDEIEVPERVLRSAVAQHPAPGVCPKSSRWRARSGYRPAVCRSRRDCPEWRWRRNCAKRRVRSIYPAACRVVWRRGFLLDVVFDGTTPPSVTAGLASVAIYNGDLYVSTSGSWDYVIPISPPPGQNHVAVGRQAGVVQAWLNGARLLRAVDDAGGADRHCRD